MFGQHECNTSDHHKECGLHQHSPPCLSQAQQPGHRSSGTLYKTTEDHLPNTELHTLLRNQYLHYLGLWTSFSLWPPALHLHSPFKTEVGLKSEINYWSKPFPGLTVCLVGGAGGGNILYTVRISHRVAKDPLNLGELGEMMWGGVCMCRPQNGCCRLLFCCLISCNQRDGEEKQSAGEEMLQQFPRH